ncbi:MAG TPA: L-histidine N(alpha)-methyltransferase, partial [Casimicrobiaceae bacterium]|nr:L-histidine N(alpha)-methyltransferase [Casimicrobiaceae bacterium]
AAKYFYDAQGGALFSAICELDEYYPTRTEQSIFVQHRAAIAECIGMGRQLVDLGAGDGRKAQQWFGALRTSRYVAVDIARAAVEPTLARIGLKYRDLDVLGVLSDFTRGLDLPREAITAPAVFFYPGSSIGNFAPDDALQFLAAVRAHCARAGAGSGLLIGVDTKKDEARLTAAYDDALGLTAAFNRNALRHVNRIIASDFDPRAFIHRAFYNARESRIEMQLEAGSEQRVAIGASLRTFAAGERITTEYSYKYAPAEFEALLRRADFAEIRLWQDPAKDFAVFYAR